MSTTWDLGGNKGTNPPKDFLGTGDSEPLVIMTNGVEKLRIDSAGNVGIGTTNPMQQLQVTGQGFFTGSGASPDPGDSSETGIRIGYQSTDDYGYINANTTGVAAKSLVLQQNGGNVGIGTSTPGRRLTLVGGADLALRLQDSSVPTGPFWELQPSAFLSDHFGIVRYEGAAQESKSLVIAPDGHFGIGTASPNCKLTVSGAETTLHGGGAAIQLTNSASGGTNWYLSVGATGTATPVGGFAIANDERFCLSITRDGNIIVGRDIMLTGADCAEEFDMAEATEIEPGTVVILDQDGVLHQSHQAYDRRVAGVISGAGDYKPGLILDRQQSHDNRVPVALVGKVYCKVDAQYAPIEVGDLLTTSTTLGHAMKAAEPSKAFGSVIGKALHPLRDGQGLIPILVALQ